MRQEHIATASLPPPTVKITIRILKELSLIDLFRRAVCQTFESRLDKYHIEGTGGFD